MSDITDGGIVAKSARQGEQKPTIQNPRDDGATLDGLDRAKIKLEGRKPSKVKLVLLKGRHMLARGLLLVAMIFTITAAIVSGVAYYTMQSSRATDTRPCSVTVGEREITGYRTYSYPYHVFSVLGQWRVVDATQVEEKTTIRLDGKPIMVIGQETGQEPWKVVTGLGELGVQPLKNAAQYTFVDGTEMKVVTYRQLCR